MSKFSSQLGLKMCCFLFSILCWWWSYEFTLRPSCRAIWSSAQLWPLFRTWAFYFQSWTNNFHNKFLSMYCEIMFLCTKSFFTRKAKTKGKDQTPKSKDPWSCRRCFQRSGQRRGGKWTRRVEADTLLGWYGLNMATCTYTLPACPPLAHSTTFKRLSIKLLGSLIPDVLQWRKRQKWRHWGNLVDPWFRVFLSLV